MAQQRKEKEYLTAVSITAGIITLIDSSGDIQYYRQRGLSRYNDEQKRVLVSIGLLAPDWSAYKELPRHIVIEFEEPFIMGQAQATYPSPEKMIKILQRFNFKG